MVEFEQDTRKDNQTIHIKYSSHYTNEIYGTIYHRACGDYQLIICYNTKWLKEAYFDTLDTAKQYVEKTEQTVLNIARKIWEKVSAVESKIVEEYKDTF